MILLTLCVLAIFLAGYAACVLLDWWRTERAEREAERDDE